MNTWKIKLDINFTDNNEIQIRQTTVTQSNKCRSFEVYFDKTYKYITIRYAKKKSISII